MQVETKQASFITLNTVVSFSHLYGGNILIYRVNYKKVDFIIPQKNCPNRKKLTFY